MSLELIDRGQLLAQVVELPADQRAWAARVVAGHPDVTDAETAADLLAMLDLDPADGVSWGRRGTPTYGLRLRGHKATKTSSKRDKGRA